MTDSNYRSHDTTKFLIEEESACDFCFSLLVEEIKQGQHVAKFPDLTPEIIDEIDPPETWYTIEERHLFLRMCFNFYLKDRVYLCTAEIEAPDSYLKVYIAPPLKPFTPEDLVDNPDAMKIKLDVQEDEYID